MRSFSVVDGMTTPSSTKMAEFVEIFSTVAETIPLEVAKVSVSSTDHSLSQVFTELRELRNDCENGSTRLG